VDSQLSKPLDDFKARELEIINHMANGLSNKEIADNLFITVGTVRWYNKQIYSKLGTSRRTEAIALARQMGLIVDNDDPQTDTNDKKHFILPETTGPFIGREQDVQEIVTLMDSPDIRLVSIIGAGGMGKSRLSLEVGHIISRNYIGGALFIDLTSIRNPDDIAQLVVSSMGLTISGSKKTEDVLFDYCREKELLLIFDNAEHVLSGMSLLADILKHASRVKIIVTTREKLNLRTETAYFLEPVMEQGHTLFIEVSNLMYPHVEFTDADTPYINDIVRLVGGVPLALILAATWVDMLSVSEIVEEIQQSLDFLQSEMADMPERQRSIRAVIDPTWKRLTQTEQQAFMRASVFRGGFTREAFQNVTGTSIRALQTLLNRSLVNHSYDRRYDMHPLVRQYAREKLVEYGMLDDAKNTHLETFMTSSKTHAERMFSGHYLDALDALEREADNTRAALDWSLQGNHIEHGVDLILAHGEFWLVRSRVQEAISYIRKAVQLSDHPMLYYWHSVYADRLGYIDEAIESARYLGAHSDETQDVELIAYGQIQLGYMADTAVAALPLFESALANALKTDNQLLIANCHSYLALVLSNSGSGESAQDKLNQHYRQALDIYEKLGDLRGVSRVTNNIAIRYIDSGQQQKANDLMEYSLQLKREIGDRAGEARRLTTLGLWSMEEEELEQAQELLKQSREICEELGELDRLSYVLTTEGLSYILMTNFQQAQATLERSLQVHRQIKDYRGTADIYGFLSLIHLLQDNLTDARTAITKGLEAIAMRSWQPAILIIAYATYLWHQRDIETCVPIVASLSGKTLNTYSGSATIVNTYFLQPLTYRLQQHIGDEAWQAAVNQFVDVTQDQLLKNMTRDMT